MVFVSPMGTDVVLNCLSLAFQLTLFMANDQPWVFLAPLLQQNHHPCDFYWINAYPGWEPLSLASGYTILKVGFWKIHTRYEFLPPVTPSTHCKIVILFVQPQQFVQKYGIRKVGNPALTVSCCVFQARNIKTGELAAVKIIKLEPGKRNLCPTGPQTTSVIVLWLPDSGVWPTDRDPDYWDYDESFTPSEQTEPSWRGGLAIFCNILSALV